MMIISPSLHQHTDFDQTNPMVNNSSIVIKKIYLITVNQNEKWDIGLQHRDMQPDRIYQA